MWIHWPFFPKTWTKGHWPLDDLWPHVCWGHMCDSTQGSLCPSPMTIHQCMWIQWSILQITTYIHTHTTYILHTTYRMSDHIVSYWTQFRRDKNSTFGCLKKKIKIFSDQPTQIQKFHVDLFFSPVDDRIMDANSLVIRLVTHILFLRIELFFPSFFLMYCN